MRLSQLRIATRGSLLLAGACLQWNAMAQGGGTSVWRCGNTYTDQACNTGQALELDDARSAAQKRDADQATRDARAEAVRMERDRLRLEATRGPGQAALIDNAPRPRDSGPAHSEALMKKPKARKDPQYLGAQEPGAPRKKKRSKASAASGLKS